jgi:hypothetical protein
MTLVQSIENNLNKLRIEAAIPQSITGLNNMINKILKLDADSSAEAWSARVELHSMIVDFDYANVQYTDSQILRRELRLA